DGSSAPDASGRVSLTVSTAASEGGFVPNRRMPAHTTPIIRTTPSAGTMSDRRGGGAELSVSTRSARLAARDARDTARGSTGLDFEAPSVGFDGAAAAFAVAGTWPE